LPVKRFNGLGTKRDRTESKKGREKKEGRKKKKKELREKKDIEERKGKGKEEEIKRKRETKTDPYKLRYAERAPRNQAAKSTLSERT